MNKLSSKKPDLLNGIFLPVIFFFSLTAFCGNKEYSAKTIPADLKQNAHAVIRSIECEMIIHDDRSASSIHKQAVTVLDEHGRRAAYLVIPYDKFIKVKNINGMVYDSEGDRMERIKLDEILDFSNIASYSLYEDQRVKYVAPDYGNYPYTIEFTYEIEYDGVFTFPSFFPMQGYHVSVEHARLLVVKPAAKNLEFKVKNIDVEISTQRKKDQEYITAEMTSLQAICHEDLAVHPSEFFPHIMYKPDSFEYGGVPGNQDTWESFGAWVWKLLEGKDQFNPETEAEIRALVADAVSDRQKIELLYKYMQQKVRYVNLSIGLGGLEPIPAQRVHEVGYGDCKALSNYMRAMLKTVGIESVFTLVYAGSKPKKVDPDFPSSQFNHAILMVPLEKDSVWLECTSTRFPSGYLGDFTDNRLVYHVLENGGELGRTPEYSTADNIVTASYTVVIDDSLAATIRKEKTSKGIIFGNEYMSYLQNDEESRKRSIMRSIHLAGFAVDSFHYHPVVSENPYLQEICYISDEDFVTHSGEYITLALNSVCEHLPSPERVRNRKLDFVVFRGRKYSDTVVYHLPGNLDVFELPENEVNSSKYGTCEVQIIPNDHSIKYIRTLTLHPGEYTSDEYGDFYRFFRSVRKTENKIALLTVNRQSAFNLK